MAQVIDRIVAEESSIALETAFYAANPGKAGAGLKDYQAGLFNRIAGRKQGEGVGIPTSALQGPMVSEVATNVIRARLERAERNVKEQETAWQTGSWPALVATLARQQAENQALA